jgi:signal transduction histidine kinase
MLPNPLWVHPTYAAMKPKAAMEPNFYGISRPSASQNEEHLRLLIETGLLLASEHSLDVIVQAALDAGLHLCGARFGAFFYNNIDDDGGEPYRLYKVSGLDDCAFAALSMPRPTGFFNATFLGQGIARSADITLDPDASRYGYNLPAAGTSPGHPPVRSYLAVPVRSRGGDVLGGLFYGHPDAGVFTPASEDLVATVASQAAVAIDNVRLSESLTREISRVDAARSLQRQTANRLRHALDAAQLGTWSWDRATDRLDLDERAAQLLHTQPHVPITRAELRDRIVSLEDKGKTTKSLRRSLVSGGLYSGEYRIDGPHGLQTWVSASGIATHALESSEVAGMVGTVQDITARRTQESALLQSEKLAATGRLAATIAHEINNPLEAVTNLIYLSRTDPQVPLPVQRQLEVADSELARVAQIAQQTLGFYRDTTRPAEIHLNELLHSVVNLFARKMVTRQIVCTLDLEPGLCIFGLQGEIRQVFSNLVVNAIDAFASVSKTGRIRIRIRGRHLRSRCGGASIVISDEGTGIPSHARERIFSPFFTTKQSIGTGLGLWVTRGFVEKHGGSIRFRTRTGNPSGTIFRVTLPARMPHADFYADGTAQGFIV